MIRVRWWVLLGAIPLLIGAGILIEYLIEGTVHSGPLRLSSPAAHGNGPTAGTTPPAGRDPAMEAGAAFMAKVTEQKGRLDKNPNDMEALIFLGNANYDIRQFDNASKYYRKALEVEPSNIQVRTDLATCYLNMGDTDKALTELRNVLKREPTHEPALYNVGLILLEVKKDRKGAIAAWEKLLKAHPDTDKAKMIRERIKKLKG